MPRGEKDERKNQNEPEVSHDDQVDRQIDHSPEDPEIAKDASPDDFE